MIQKQNIPKFTSEAEEAGWWDQHREETAQWMEEAAATGQTTTLSDVVQRARQRAGTTPTVTYLKMLLHEALQREERTG